MEQHALALTFVGRSRELVEVGRLLERSRLVTMMGAGGSGKTRLAVEAGSRLVERFPGGVFLCELAPISTPDLVAGAVATALGFAPEVRTDLARLAGERVGPDPALLILDNCEHVREVAAAAARAVLEGAPGLRVLATSRERLRLPGETAWMLPGLEATDAIALLADRAAGLDPGFQATDLNHAALTEICRRLDGLPLAIELVAPRLALLPADQVAGMLDHALGLLAGGEGQARHQTMRAALDWSVDLLAREAQRDLWQVGVFPATFRLEGAAAVLDVRAPEALDRLAMLRDRSLLVSDTSAPVARFRLLEPVRQYAAERLAGEPDEDEVRRRHAMHVLDVAEWIGATVLASSDQPRALASFTELLPDVRQAVAWALEGEPGWAARIVAGCSWAFEITGRLQEGEALMQITVGGAATALDRATILVRLTSLLLRRRTDKPDAISQAAVAAAREAGDPRELGFALSFAATMRPPAEARAILDEAAALADATGDRLLLAFERFLRASCDFIAGDIAAARAGVEYALSVSRELGDPWLTMQSTVNVIGFSLSLGDNQAARRHLRNALPVLAANPDWVARGALTFHTARLAARVGKPREALQLLAAHRRIREEMDSYQWEAEEIEQAARAELPGPREYQAALAEGARLSLAGAVALARAVVEEPLERPDNRLTRRELEIARLVARGLSNQEMADQLHLSVRTVEGHVEHVLAKLDLRSRVQIATWAAEHALL